MTEDAPKSPIELPMAMWVRGGTHTAAHDRQVAEARADAERRRQVEDNRQRFVMKNPSEARLRSLNLNDSSRHPMIVLKVTRPEDLVCEMTCELLTRPVSVPMRDGRDFQWILQMVCPACVYRHNRLVGESQLTIQELNREFEVDQRRAGELYVTPGGKAYTLAGTIHVKDWVSCDYCHFRFTIGGKEGSEIISR